MMRKEFDEHLYIIKKYTKELEKYLDCKDFLNAHHVANLISYHASRISTCEQCHDALCKKGRSK